MGGVDKSDVTKLCGPQVLDWEARRLAALAPTATAEGIGQRIGHRIRHRKTKEPGKSYLMTPELHQEEEVTQ